MVLNISTTKSFYGLVLPKVLDYSPITHSPELCPLACCKINMWYSPSIWKRPDLQKEYLRSIAMPELSTTLFFHV